MSENIRESLEKLSEAGTEDERLLPCVLLRMLDDFNEVKTEIGKVKTEVDGVKTEISEVKTEIKAETDKANIGIGEVKTETGKVKAGIGEVNGEIKTEISEARTAQRKEIRIVGICTVIIISLVVFAGIFWLSRQ